MEKRTQVRQSSGAKAIALDHRKVTARYRLLRLQLLAAAIFSAAFAMGLHFFFGR
ncbi:MAG: hypothetical protein JO215_09285 [Ktedonobacteraceae bacterium]|nr:hypothetical protein [Ktedonobacteraceae bacterium]MBV9617044.1 hypothetical protein [Ktedonobacteraceae bacterium]MBV9711361.1 hypothetical protein [Ktedonobacteraceae bacterium]